MQTSLKMKCSLLVVFALNTLVMLPAQTAAKGKALTGGHIVATSENTLPPVTTHERFITFLTDKEFKSELLLENLRLDSSMTVKPAFITGQGEIPLKTVTMPPHSSATVDVNSSVPIGGSGKQGLIVVRYDSDSYGSISAVIQSSDEKHKLYLSSVGWSREEFWYGTTLDAVIWAPESETQGFVSLVNTSSEPRIVHATFIVGGRSEDAPQIRIAPRQAEFLPIDSLVARSHENGAGIHLAFTGNPGDITAEGTLFNKETGFSQYIRFADTSLKFTSTSLRTNFLLVGQQPAEDHFPTQILFHSVAAVRNVDSSPVEVTPIVTYVPNGSVQTVTLPKLTLGVQESKVLDFNQLQNEGELPLDFKQGSLELRPNTNHNSIVAELFNFNEATGGYVVGSSFTAHPTRATGAIWRIDGTYQTTIMVQNTAAEDDKVSLKLFSGTDTYNKSFPLGAGKLLKINLRQLQQEAVPDDDGNVLTALSGTLSLSGSKGIGTKLAFDKLIHSADASEYVGLPANPCVYVYGIVLVLYSTNDPAIFNAFVDANWTDGTVTEDQAFPSSSNSSEASVNGNVVTLHAVDGSSHSVSLQMSQNYPACDACSADTFFAQHAVSVPACGAPTNFSQGSCSDIGNGTLEIHYTWGSSTGNVSDLSASGCTMGEIVTYPGSSNPYNPPSPPFPTNNPFTNPTILDFAAFTGRGVDDHGMPSTTFVKPYSNQSFTATQFYRYKCACGSNANNYVNVAGPLSIVRSVSRNSNGSFEFTVTKSGCQAAINPLP